MPEGLDWDLWIGPAPYRPYHPAYHPWTWRNWWDFGTGLLGDLGCHKLPPKTLPRSPGHYAEFVAACRGGPPAGSNFVDHAGLLTEVCLLGNVAVHAGKKLLWDGVNMRFTNDAGANRWLHRNYRPGWSL